MQKFEHMFITINITAKSNKEIYPRLFIFYIKTRDFDGVEDMQISLESENFYFRPNKAVKKQEYKSRDSYLKTCKMIIKRYLKDNFSDYTIEDIKVME